MSFFSPERLSFSARSVSPCASALFLLVVVLTVLDPIAAQDLHFSHVVVPPPVEKIDLLQEPLLVVLELPHDEVNRKTDGHTGISRDRFQRREEKTHAPAAEALAIPMLRQFWFLFSWRPEEASLKRK